MKVTVKDQNLNVRAGSPSLNAPIYNYLEPGTIFEVDGKVYQGDTFDGVDTWLKDESDNYYWSGDVQSSIPDADFASPLPPIANAQTSFPWFDALKINTVWNTYHETGGRAKIAVLDTGYCFSNTDLNCKFKDGDGNTSILLQQSDYPGVPLIMDDQDTGIPGAHGTRCCSLVAAANKGKWLIGVAPDAVLMAGKLSIDGTLPNFQHILDGIAWAIKKGADIISISYYVPLSEAEIAKYGAALTKLVQDKNVLIFACAGNSAQPQETKDYYPASFPECISVGASTLTGGLSEITALSKKTVLHAPGEQVESYNLQNVPEAEDGTSFSTPIAAGLAALAVSWLKRKNGSWEHEKLLQKMQDSADDIPNQPGKKIINPINLFQSL